MCPLLLDVTFNKVCHFIYVCLILGAESGMKCVFWFGKSRLGGGPGCGCAPIPSALIEWRLNAARKARICFIPGTEAPSRMMDPGMLLFPEVGWQLGVGFAGLPLVEARGALGEGGQRQGWGWVGCYQVGMSRLLVFSNLYDSTMMQAFLCEIILHIFVLFIFIFF